MDRKTNDESARQRGRRPASRRPTKGGSAPASPPEPAPAAPAEALAPGAREAIARRAYEMYLERGAMPGRELEDWLHAERELALRQSR